MNQTNAVVLAMRLPFITLSVVCVVAGVSVALLQHAEIDILNLVLVGIGAIAAHIAVNTLNEYQDFSSGLDLKTQRTPFSGGSGGLPANPLAAKGVKLTFLLSLGLCVVCGVYLMLLGFHQLLWIGLLGIVIIVTYTRWINRMPIMCLLAPGLGFALIVVGTVVVMGGSLSSTVFALCLIVGLLVSNILLLNQFPDIEADRSVGRKHILISHGEHTGATVYGLFVIICGLTIIYASVVDIFPRTALFALLFIPLGLLSWQSAAQLGRNIGQQPKFLAMNIAMGHLVPLTLAVCFYVAS